MWIYYLVLACHLHASLQEMEGSSHGDKDYTCEDHSHKIHTTCSTDWGFLFDWDEWEQICRGWDKVHSDMIICVSKCRVVLILMIMYRCLCSTIVFEFQACFNCWQLREYWQCLLRENQVNHLHCGCMLKCYVRRFTLVHLLHADSHKSLREHR